MATPFKKDRFTAELALYRDRDQRAVVVLTALAGCNFNTRNDSVDPETQHKSRNIFIRGSFRDYVRSVSLFAPFFRIHIIII